MPNPDRSKRDTYIIYILICKYIIYNFIKINPILNKLKI